LAQEETERRRLLCGDGRGEAQRHFPRALALLPTTNANQRAQDWQIVPAAAPAADNVCACGAQGGRKEQLGQLARLRSYANYRTRFAALSVEELPLACYFQSQ
jgi:hypothetical protein